MHGKSDRLQHCDILLEHLRGHVVVEVGHLLEHHPIAVISLPLRCNLRKARAVWRKQTSCVVSSTVYPGESLVSHRLLVLARILKITCQACANSSLLHSEAARGRDWQLRAFWRRCRQQLCCDRCHNQTRQPNHSEDREAPPSPTYYLAAMLRYQQSRHEGRDHQYQRQA